jgi:hypothetical protein
LGQQRLGEAQLVTRVRVPLAVQAGEARRRQWLVDWRVLLDPGIALRNSPGVCSQTGWKGRVQQIRVTRAAAMVYQTRDRADAKFAQSGQALVGPAPVGVSHAVWRGSLPQNRVPHRADSQPGDQIQVAQAVVMTAADGLVKVPITNPINRCLRAAPQLHWRQQGIGRTGK